MRQQNDTYTRSLPGLNVPKGHGRAKGPETTRKARKSAKALSPAPTSESASASFSQTAFQGLLHESPACTQEKFAELTGLTKRAVECQVQRGYLPTFKLGRYRLINLVAWRALLHAEANPLAVAPGKPRVKRGAH